MSKSLQTVCRIPAGWDQIIEIQLPLSGGTMVKERALAESYLLALHSTGISGMHSWQRVHYRCASHCIANIFRLQGDEFILHLAYAI